MHKLLTLATVFALGFVQTTDLFGQAKSEDSVMLPKGLQVIDNGPRTYRFDVDYITANTKGETIMRQRLSGEYTRALPDGKASWKNVTLAEAMGPTAEYGSKQKRDFMDDFQYANKLDETFKPEFFKDFPPAAVIERNLVWDTGMFEFFAQDFFDKLELNTPLHTLSNQDVHMPNLGTFTNRDVVLEWIGTSQRNGQECALISYEAFLNPLKVETGGMSLQGRSDYWGQLWVSKSTKQIEYATLREVVVAELKLPGQETAQVINVFRNGTFKPVKAGQ
jgi:hypothetical protein